jgi:hypothetical protein
MLMRFTEPSRIQAERSQIAFNACMIAAMPGLLEMKTGGSIFKDGAICVIFPPLCRAKNP